MKKINNSIKYKLDLQTNDNESEKTTTDIYKYY
jgi:hypothetical protein